jgi:hypothetical protein
MSPVASVVACCRVGAAPTDAVDPLIGSLYRNATLKNPGGFASDPLPPGVVALAVV